MVWAGSQKTQWSAGFLQKSRYADPQCRGEGRWEVREAAVGAHPLCHWAL